MKTSFSLFLAGKNQENVFQWAVFACLIANAYLIFFSIKLRRGVLFSTMISFHSNQKAVLLCKTVIVDYCFHLCGYRAQFCLNTWLDIQAFGYFFFGKPITHLSIQAKQATAGANHWPTRKPYSETKQYSCLWLKGQNRFSEDDFVVLSTVKKKLKLKFKKITMPYSVFGVWYEDIKHIKKSWIKSRKKVRWVQLIMFAQER